MMTSTKTAVGVTAVVRANTMGQPAVDAMVAV
ncbi:hypothetical protein UFOVP128_51 [uncultured Caudovirales phage]|uniref:Uncharacterized protein n=1 Tax=uncultured Caudovirales phage TaxID=2100421 RepID=A0A6J7WVF0_9CAUD|nr:hypothetical protein UFOVP128_51 [uncultured Caudovirales phage]CAB5222099.1 hypothetical protein UFOVP243_68 [uncultured Caudovirales phage]